MNARRSFLILLPVAFATALADDALSQSNQPQPPPDDWEGTDFSTAHYATVGEGVPFDPSIHRNLTPQGMICSEQINAAIYRQDVGHAFESRAHFDNCAFDASVSYVQALIAEADRLFSEVALPAKEGEVPSGVRSGMLALGQALHAIQDFYSHSNYIELIQSRAAVPPLERDVPALSIWTAEGKARLASLRKEGLVSGRVWWSLPHRCSSSVPTHEALAKDAPTTAAGAKPSPWKGTDGKFVSNHVVAYNLAHRATRNFLAWSAVRWPKIPAYCGTSIGYIMAPDRRSMEGDLQQSPSVRAAAEGANRQKVLVREDLTTLVHPVPACRFDDSLIPYVQTALDWGTQTLKTEGVTLPYGKIIINPRATKATRDTLLVYLIKDSTESVVQPDGCIELLRMNALGMLFYSDGPCTSIEREECLPEDKQYMRARFEEIHSGFSNTRTGYELAGACMLTNQHACLDDDRRTMLAWMGPRDGLTVRGGCVSTNHGDDAPATIKCSAGALKMLISREAAESKAPTVGLLFLLAHELGHLVNGVSSSFAGIDATIDRSWSLETKRKVLTNICNAGLSFRKQEEDADAIALKVTARYVKEITRRWPEQGTVSWAISQAGHFFTNLARWNNGWADAQEFHVPEMFLQNRGGGVLEIDPDDLELMERDPLATGRTPEQISRDTREFLSQLRASSTGQLGLVMQSGTTHSTMPERLIFVLEGLRSVGDDNDDSASRLESMLSDLQLKVARMHRNYLRELEKSICLAASDPETWKE